MKKELVKETIRYLIVGAFTTVLSIALLWLFYDMIGIEKNLSNIISNIITIIVAYVLNRVIVFKSKNDAILSESLKFLGSRIVVAIIDVILFYLLSIIITQDFKVFSITISSVIIVKIIVNIVVIVLNYLFSKLFVFKTNQQN